MYKADWDNKDVQRQQMGCALYFIDQLALRAGHEKDEDEADTVGCCTLKVGPALATYLQEARYLHVGSLPIEAHVCLIGIRFAAGQTQLQLPGPPEVPLS